MNWTDFAAKLGAGHYASGNVVHGYAKLPPERESGIMVGMNSDEFILIPHDAIQDVEHLGESMLLTPARQSDCHRRESLAVLK